METHTPDADALAGLTRVLVLAGPTAVGKTELSLQLAQATSAEIVGMDSVQIYRELDIGSAKATEAERARVPHHVIDVLEPDVEHNVGDYAERARAAIDEIAGRGRRAIVVGGTGLYLRVLVHGLLDAPPPDWELRAEHDRAASERGV
ncbi:MAG: isopentenyl transferase family protein, partial [Myxococcota bacterium]